MITLTGDGAAIHAAILREPGEDLHRLAFADWLDRHGEPERAEFIRVQVARDSSAVGRHVDLITRGEASGCPGAGCPLCLRWRADEDKLAALLLAHESDWLGPDWPLWVPGAEWHWRRGFVERVELSALRFVGGRAPGLARAIFAAHPVTRVVLPEVRAIRSNRGPGFKCWSLVTHIDLTRILELRDAFVWHETEEGAIGLFSNALVNYGRAVAGLPPIGSPEADFTAEAPASQFPPA